MEHVISLAKLQQPFLSATTGNWDITNGQPNYTSGATISNVPDPVDPQDIATKAYVDENIYGMAWKEPAKVASTTNVDIASLQNGSIVNGITVVTGDRVLLRGQTTATENGVYVVPATAPATRAYDWQTGWSAANFSIFVSEGSDADRCFTVANNTGGDVIGTHALSFIQFAGAGLMCSGKIGDCQLGINGSPGPYSFEEDNITPNTERIYLNGLRLRRTEDYTIDYTYGEVTFTFNLKNNPGQTDVICADYCHAEFDDPPGPVLTNLIHDWNAESLIGFVEDDPIGSVADDVGTLTLEQTVAANRPTYVTDNLCSPLIRFDHSVVVQSLVTESALELFKDRDATLVMSFNLRAQSTSLGQRMFEHGAEYAYMSAFGATNYPAGYTDANDNVATQPDRNMGNYFRAGFYVVHLRRDGDQLKMRVSGNDEGDVTLPTNTAPVTAVLQIAGSSTGVNRSAPIDVSRILVYDRALTDAEMLKNETALARQVSCFADTPKPPDVEYVPDENLGTYDGTYKHWHWYDLASLGLDHGERVTTWPAWKGGVDFTQAEGSYNTVKPWYLTWGGVGYNLHGRTNVMQETYSWLGTPAVLIDQRDGSASADHCGMNSDTSKPFKLWNESGGHTQGTFIIVWMPVDNMFTESYNKTLFSHAGLNFQVTTNGDIDRPGLVGLPGFGSRPFETWSDQPTGWYRQWNMNIMMFDRYDDELRCSRNGYLRKTHTGLTGWTNAADVLNIGEGDTINQLRYCCSFLVAEVIILPYSVWYYGGASNFSAWDFWWAWLINYYTFMAMYVPWTLNAAQIPDNHGDDPAANMLFGRQPILG